MIWWWAKLKFPMKGGIPGLPGHAADPGKNFSFVLVVQEVFGVHEHIKDLCRSLAKSGYMGVAPGSLRSPRRSRRKSRTFRS